MQAPEGFSGLPTELKEYIFGLVLDNKTRSVSKEWNKITDEMFQRIFNNYEQHPSLEPYTKRAKLGKGTDVERVSAVYNTLMNEARGLDIKETISIENIGDIETLSKIADEVQQKKTLMLLFFFDRLIDNDNSTYPFLGSLFESHRAFSDFKTELKEITNPEEKALKIREWMENNQSLLRQVRELKIIELPIHPHELVYLPDEIGYFRGLEKLYLDCDCLTTLPESIGQLDTLNKLTILTRNLRSLPKSIGDLRQLVTFSINMSKLTSLPETIGRLENLEHLEIDSGNLVSLPDSIGKLKKLKDLSLPNNQLRSLPEAVGQLKSLDTLVLLNNPLESLPESITQLENLKKLYIKKCPELKTLPDFSQMKQKPEIIK